MSLSQMLSADWKSNYLKYLDFFDLTKKLTKWYLIYTYRKLKRLNLGGNELTSVPQRALSIFDALRKLEIQENKIRIIKEGDFEGSLD